MTSELRWGWVVSTTPRPLYPRERPGTHCRPQGRSGRVRKISPPPGFDPRTVQPVVSRYTDWAIPAHMCILYKSANRLHHRYFENWAFEEILQTAVLFSHFVNGSNDAGETSETFLMFIYQLAMCDVIQVSCKVVIWLWFICPNICGESVLSGYICSAAVTAAKHHHIVLLCLATDFSASVYSVVPFKLQFLENMACCAATVFNCSLCDIACFSIYCRLWRESKLLTCNLVWYDCYRMFEGMTVSYKGQYPRTRINNVSLPLTRYKQSKKSSK